MTMFVPGSVACDVAVVDVSRPLTQMRGLKNMRGASQRLDPPQGAIDKGRRLAVLDTNSSSCVVGELLCVTLGITLADLPDDSEEPLEDAFVYPSVRAHLRWGQGGATFFARCDWRRGTQLSICAETIAIEAQYLKNSLPWDPTDEVDAPSFQVSAGVGYGNVGRNSNPATLTELVQILESDGTQRIPIPPFATSFQILPVGDSSGSAVYFPFGSSYAVPVAIANPLDPYSVENAFPSFNGARFLEIKNESSETPFVGFVIFGLAL